MSKRTRDSNTMDIDEPLGPRAAKKKVLDIQAQERAKKDVAAQKRQVNKKLRADVDDLSNLFGNMKSNSQESVDDLSDMMGHMSTEGKGRRRRRTRKSKKSKKTKKTRKH
jgi:hypothetical protein